MVCESMAVGGLAALDEPLPALIMQSPSKHCMRLLAVADLHAAACRVQSSGAFGAGSFLTLRIGRTCPGSSAPWEADHEKGWSLAQPRGMQIEVEAAGIVVMHNTDAVVAALSFFGQLDRHRHMPLARPALPVPAHASPVTPPDPTQPQTLSQRAKQAFTHHNLPIRRKLAIPLTSVRLSCPGIVGVIQYHHSVNGPGRPKKEAPSGAAAQPAPGSEYELVAAVSGIRAQVYGEDFQDFMHHGATQRSSVHAYMDLFCYQAPASRRRGDALQRRLLSFRTVAARSHFLRRETSEDLGSQEAADPDMQAMAQVWGHPEDLHLYPGPGHHEEQRLKTQQDRRTSFMSSASGGGPHRTSSSGGPPPAEDTCPPFPLVPLLKVASMHAELSQKVVLVPTAPTSLNASLALGAIGIMVWVSPWQVAHVLSIVRTLQGDLAPAWQPAAAARSAARRRPSSRPSFLSSSHLHIACTLDVPLISAIVMVSKDSSNAVAGTDGGTRFRRWEWGRQIGEGQAAHAWSRFLTPLYGIQVIGLLASMTYSGTGRLRAGLTMDGVLVRDLQLRPTSKFAFLLRPLPARAAQLASYATSFRRRILRVVGTSKAKKRWNRATRMIVLRLRAKQRMFFGSSASVGAMRAGVKANSFLSSGVLGPQLSLAFNLAPPQPHVRGHGPRPLPEPADLQIEVGQMLTNLRVSTNNMLLPFTAQILQLLQDTGAPKAMGEGGSGEQVSSPRQRSGMAFPGLKVRSRFMNARVIGSQKPLPCPYPARMQLGMVGLDLVLLVMGRELVSFKIVDAALTVDVASASEAESSANPSAVTIGLTVEDMSLRDMQARPEHSMVLRPNSAAESCSLTLEYTQPLKRSQPPSLIIEMANPRMLVLFRFLHDILFGVQIITKGLKGSASLLEEPGSAQAPSAHQPVQKPARQEEEEEQTLPLQLLIFVTNLSVLLPASSKSRQVLECDADTLIVGVPGLALPDSALATALLPSVPDMVDASLRCSRLAQKVARPAPDTPEGQPDNAAGNDGGDGQKDGSGSADADAEEDEHLEVHNSDSVFTKAMKNFAQWEAREERRLHKDLQQHQRGVLFLGDPPPDPTPPDTSTGVLRVPDQATGSAAPSSLRRAARRTPFAEASGQVPAPVAPSTLPEVPEAAAAGPSLAGRADKGKQAAQSRPEHEDVLAGAEASGLQVPGRMSSAPAELPSLQSHGPVHHSLSPSGVAEDEAPEVTVAILADGLVVRCASLGPTVAAPSRRRTEFCPNTVDVFAWPMDQYDLTTRAPFIHQANYALVMFEQRSAAHAYTQLHLTASTLAATLNNANYSALLGFAQGNLAEMSSFSRAQQPTAQPQERRTTFAESFCFEPPAGDRPSFYMTVSAPDLTVVLEAEPREWQSDCCMEGSAPSHLHPFLKTRFEDVAMDLATLQGSGATHISITAGTVQANDLRMAYSRALRHLEIVRDGASAFAVSSAFSAGGEGPSSGVHFSGSDGSAMGGPSWERVASRLGASNAAAPLSMAPPAAAGPARLGMGDLLLERCTSISIVKKAPRSAQGLSAGQRAATLGPPGTCSPLRPPAADQGSARSGAGPSKLPTDAGSSQQGSSRRGKRAATAAPQPWYMPVVEVVTVPELSMAFPQGAPVVHLIRSPVVLQEKEAVHLMPDEDTNMPEGVTLEVALGLLKGGTVAIQAALAQAQLQWPFLHDVSLVSAITSVFLPAPAPGQRGDADAAAAAGAVASALQAGPPQPWLYFNLLTVNSALFVPVLDKVATFETVRQKFGPAAAHTNLHDRLADVLLVATALSGESPDTAMRLEQRGLAASWSGLRFAFATGGDGESDMRVDLRNFAAFVRDPAALVSCLLLPHSCSVPRVAEAAQVSEDAPAASQAQDTRAAVGDAERNKAKYAAERAQRSTEERAAIAIQRAFRRWRRRKRRSSRAQDDWMQTTAAEVLQRLGRPPPLKVPSPTEESLIDELVMKVASPRTKDLLQDYTEQYRADDRARVVAVNHAPTSVRLGAKLGSLTLRAAFSHIPFLHSAQWMLQAVCLSPDASAGELASAAAAAGQEVGFRPSKLRVDAVMRAVSLVLCNDKLSTYGAPDVLQVSLDQLDAHFSRDRCFADRPSNQARPQANNCRTSAPCSAGLWLSVGRVTMRLWASFLNNSSSRWEPIWENWPLQIDMVDNVSPIYRSDFTRRLWVGSEEHLNVQFNPAALLSLGDARAFLEALSDVEPRMPAVPRGGPTPSTVSTTSRLAQLDAAPQMAEQMAQRGSITSRVPQKYLIQNQSGLTVFYWVDPAEGAAQRTFSLECGASETLKVAPTRKVLNISTFSKGGCIEKVGNVINLYFEGNWMPIKDVAVSVVGKYRYFMHSPAEHDSVPVIVDIILVGRTKIITLHSSIWLDNRTDRRVAFRLHVPITPLVAPVAEAPGSSAAADFKTDAAIGPLSPGEGTLTCCHSKQDSIL
ncbi:hypothetical protein COCOBI_12-5530 [Coccomyxa sp. Obi]|nr:hypothetical protein COCOBI_12-5530 [Coccomyxa sp. Obi]